MFFLESTPNLFWSSLASTSNYAAIAPIVIGGGLTLFKEWIASEDNIRTRVDTQTRSLRENINSSVHILLVKAVLSLAPKDLRGDISSIPPKPDAVGDCITEIFKVLKKLYRLELVLRRTGYAFTYLFYTIVFGVLSLLVVNLVDTSRPYLALLNYIIIVTQLVAVVFIRRYKKQLESHEQTT